MKLSFSKPQERPPKERKPEPQTEEDLNLNKQFWDACTEGDLTTVKNLLSHPKIDVNLGDSHLQRTPLYRACGHGRVDVVRELLRDPRVLVNKQQSQGGSPLCVAAQQGFCHVIALLLADHRIEVNLAQNEGCTPLYLACSHSKTEVVKLLLKDPRTDVNIPSQNQASCVFICSQENHLEVLETLLEDKRVDINMGMVNGETPLWIAAHKGRLQVVRWLLTRENIVTGVAWKGNNRNEAEQAEANNFPEISNLIKSFDQDREGVRRLLRKELGIQDKKAAEVFALVILATDDYLRIDGSNQSPQDENRSEAERFFHIARRLPLELQMLVSNLSFELSKSHILTKHSEPAFKKFLLSS